MEVLAVPCLLQDKDLGRLLQSLGEEESKPSLLEHGMDHILATIACHGAIRAGDPLSPQDLKELLKEAQRVDFYHNCPHGRRVFHWLQAKQVASFFDR